MTVELLSRTADDDVIIRLFRVQNITRVGGFTEGLIQFATNDFIKFDSNQRN